MLNQESFVGSFLCVPSFENGPVQLFSFIHSIQSKFHCTLVRVFVVCKICLQVNKVTVYSQV